jgi:hypothetical protein
MYFRMAQINNIIVMKTPIIVVLLISLSLANVHPHPDPIVTHTPKVYKVDIDEAPITRWAPIIKDFQ